jgi:hypothetical protein
VIVICQFSAQPKWMVLQFAVKNQQNVENRGRHPISGVSAHLFVDALVQNGVASPVFCGRQHFRALTPMSVVF